MDFKFRISQLKSVFKFINLKKTYPKKKDFHEKNSFVLLRLGFHLPEPRSWSIFDLLDVKVQWMQYPVD